MNRSRAFTLIELLVVVSIIAVLAGMLFPVFGRAKAHSRSVRCVSNLRQLGLAIKAYCNDHGDRLPVIDTLFQMNADRRKGYDPLRDPARLTPRDVLGAYLVDARILVCPAAVNGLPYGNPERWEQTYVFYGRDYEKTIYGYFEGEESFLNLDQFNGQVQQTVLAHGAPNEVSGVIWVRDSYNRVGDPRSRVDSLPHSGGYLNRLYADGHVARTHSDSHIRAADF